MILAAFIVIAAFVVLYFAVAREERHLHEVTKPRKH